MVAQVVDVIEVAGHRQHPDRTAQPMQPTVVGGYRLGDIRHVFASPDRAADVLGFRAAIGFDDGIREFVTAPLRAPGGAQPR
jgi:nucleoside-diphosphate-sugar epimerase